MSWHDGKLKNRMNIFPSHVSLVVHSVPKAADYLSRFGFQIGPEEVWDDEGTREIYIERGKANSLLLMEPIQPGAYQRAMDKRGPGLHHLAIDVLDLDTYLLSLAGSGWLLHPMSVQTMKKAKTAYLARPGFPTLIEGQERETLTERPLFVTGVSLPYSLDLGPLVARIGLERIVTRAMDETTLSVADQKIELRELLR